MQRHTTARTTTAKRLFLLALAATCLPLPAIEEQGLSYFENKVRPLLIEHCYKCHSADAKKLKANLYLDSRAGWKTGGDTGPALVPGKPDESLLMHAVMQTKDDLQMPPKTRLSNDEINTLHTWISMGAPDPRKGEVNRSPSKIDIEKGREFWSFKAPVAHPVPTVRDSSWPTNDIDRFLLSRLEKEGLAPTEDAPPHVLLRRIYYDLIGLPPTQPEITAFLADPSPKAFERVVDDLLARPEFGERWGRHWLDVTRFAESSGGGRSLVFPHAWRFRDYVIDSFNEDKPYDQFVREHLAGDVLPHDSDEQRNEQLVASGYLVLGPINYELQDQELLRMEFVDEQIDALGRTFLGMTLGCARCHDHKFDPIPTSDYYALAGIFQSTESMGKGSAASGVSSVATVNLDVPETGELKELRKTLAGLNNTIAANRKLLNNSKNGAAIDPAKLPGIVIDSPAAKISGRWKSSIHVSPWVGADYIHDEGQPKGENQVEFSTTVPASRDYEVLIAYSSGTNRAKNTPVTINHADGKTTVTIDQTKSPSVQGCFVSVGTFPFSTDQPARVIISNKGTNGVVIADAVSFADPNREKVVREPSLDRNKFETELKSLEKERKIITAKLKKLQPIAMAPTEAETLADGYVHIRGQARNKGAKVPRGFLSVATKPNVTPEIAANSSGRTELAHWIASADNPLTARVMTNRIWQHLLGEGIVRTPDNFGQTGEAPSHPELLDHLTRRFVEDGWSMKSLIREIALSRAYQLSSQGDSTADPENRLFGRAHPKRLEAEAIRDTALLVSGQFDPTRGGYTLGNPGQYDLNYKFNTVRRSVYVPRFRNSILDLFDVFDAANPNLVVGKRPTTNLPTQALFLMNSQFIREQSQLTAQRLLHDGASIEDAYTLILCRPPTEAEQTATRAFLAEFEPGDRKEAWAQVCQSLFSCLDFRFLN